MLIHEQQERGQRHLMEALKEQMKIFQDMIEDQVSTHASYSNIITDTDNKSFTVFTAPITYQHLL